MAEFHDPDRGVEQQLERDQQSLILNEFISELPDESRGKRGLSPILCVYIHL